MAGFSPSTYAALVGLLKDTLSGIGAIQGEPGRSPEFRQTTTHIQWRYVGDTAWLNLVPLNALLGPQGESPQFRMNGNWLQYRFTTQPPTAWTDIHNFPSIGASNDFANAIKKEVSGNPIRLDDVQPNTTLTTMVVNGLTTQIGTGVKSPDNPFELVGANASILHVTGRNLISLGNISKYRYENGTLNTQNDKIIGKDFEWYIRFDDTKAIPGQTYIFSCANVITTAPNLGSVRFNDYETSDYTTSVTLNSQFKAILQVPSQYKNPVLMYYRGGVGGIPYDFELYKPQLEIGNASNPYKTFIGESYPINLTEPLYSLPNGVRDTFAVVTGVLMRSIGVKVFDGTEYISQNTPNNYHIFYYSLPNIKFLNSVLTSGNSSHFNNTTNLTVAGNMTLGYFSRSVFFVFAQETNPGEVKGWFKSQYDDGNPVTIVYELESPQVINLTPLIIPAYAPTTIAQIDQSDMSLIYNRDLEIIINKLMYAITQLGGTVDV